jgi:hypothetical protein
VQLSNIPSQKSLLNAVKRYIEGEAMQRLPAVGILPNIINLLPRMRGWKLNRMYRRTPVQMMNPETTGRIRGRIDHVRDR